MTPKERAAAFANGMFSGHSDLYRNDLATAFAETRRQALEAAALIARDGCLVPPDGGSPNGAEVAMCNWIAGHILALIDQSPEPARGRAYIEWRDDMESAKNGRSVWVGQRGAIGVHSTRWQENQWMGLPRGYAQPDCWAEIVPPPAREKPAATGADGGTEFTSHTVDGVPTRVRYTPLPDDLPTRSFRAPLTHALAMDARVLWPVEDSGELRALADEWEKQDG